MRDRLVSTLDAARRRLYSGNVKRAVRAIGLEQALFRIYTRVEYALSNERRTRTIDGASATFTVSRDGHWFFKQFEDWDEYPVIEDLLTELDPGDTFYDVGASRGVYACLAADRVANGEVIAFEPHPVDAERLEANAEVNDAPVRVLRYALSDQSGEGTLNLAGLGVAAGTHSLTGTSDGEAGTVDVDLIPGDELVATGEIPPPNVVKIDVEGAELDVIRGLEDALARDACRLVYCEVHLPDGENASIEDHGGTAEELHETLSRLGFDVERLHERETNFRTYHIKARKA